LQVALEGLAARSSVGSTVVRFRPHLECPIALDVEARNHLYRIAQEAVQNALKHAGARVIEIELWARPHGVTLTVNDDGVGLSRAGPRSGGFGMRTMQFRASSIGGRLSEIAWCGGGVSVVCEVDQRSIDAAA